MVAPGRHPQLLWSPQRQAVQRKQGLFYHILRTWVRPGEHLLKRRVLTQDSPSDLWAIYVPFLRPVRGL